MGMGRDDKKFYRNINKISVPAYLFHKVMYALCSIKFANGYEPTSIKILRICSMSGYTFDESRQLSKSIMFRLEALSLVMKEANVQGWFPDPDFYSDTDDPYLTAAAEEPLRPGSGTDVVFDTQSFRTRVLNNKS